MPTATATPSSHTKDGKQPANKEALNHSWVGRVPQLKPGTYSDGHPFHQPTYLCCKLVLRPNRFASRESLFEFGEVMREPAKEHGVGFANKGFVEQPLKIREVLFIDTEDFLLYNNAFILRRRIPYKEGFPIGDPEVVFKFRHPDMQAAAEMDVRPHILGDHRVKFKCQALPLKEKLGGIRLLFSHSVQFTRSALDIKQVNPHDMDAVTQVFPVLAQLKKRSSEKIKLVSDTIIEEVLQDIGRLDFGQGLTCKANVSVWRTRGEHRPLIGEFAFQVRFKDRKDLGSEALQRMEAFFVALQYAAEEYIELNATKTGMVYRLLGNPPKAYE